jgi:hypothetical protein
MRDVSVVSTLGVLVGETDPSRSSRNRLRALRQMLEHVWSTSERALVISTVAQLEVKQILGGLDGNLRVPSYG